jgi:four helix bundle protein
MALKFEELEILQKAEAIADGLWKDLACWDPFVRETVGGQLARASDSIGANIAEAFGRFHFGEKVQFLYYARGSLYETKYWINRTQARQLMSAEQAQNYAKQLSELARQLNAFISHLKSQRRRVQSQSKTVSESSTSYKEDQTNHRLIPMFTEDDINWIEAVPNT